MLVKFNPNGTQVVAQPDLAAQLQPWREHLALRVAAGELSADTASLYFRGAGRFLVRPLDGAGSGDAIRHWKAQMLTEGMKPSSVNVWLAGVRSFFAWLAETNQISFDPAAKIKGASRKGAKKRHVRQSLTDSEVVRLLAKPDRSSPQGARDYAILSLMLYTAARGIEVHRSDLGDLKTVQGKLVLAVQGKGDIEKSDILVLPHEAEDAMRDWLTLRGKKRGPLFVSVSNRSMDERLSRRALRQMVKGYFAKAGIVGDDKTTHSLRHTAISSAIRHHAPAEKVRGMSRHASLDTLMIYYHEADRIDDPAENYISYNNGQ